MTICSRPDCTNPVKSGRKYCSNKCSANDRKRVKDAFGSTSLSYPNLPNHVSELILEHGGNDQILKEVNLLLEEQSKEFTPPLMNQGLTFGDWTLSMNGNDYRPLDALSFTKINDMLRCGAVKFALEMKIAGVASPFRNDTGWVIYSPDKELAEMSEAALRNVLPKMITDIMYSALAYGASFQELVWERKSKYQLGMTQSKSGLTSYTVPKVPNSVDPETVIAILRDTETYRFRGFSQRHPKRFQPIEVLGEAALVVPYNERFRNLWGESFLLPIYPLWFWYEIVLRSMVRFMHRMATPVTVVKAPSKGKVNKPGTTVPINPMMLGLAIAGNAANSNALVLPSDIDPETKTPLWDIFYLSAKESTQPFIDVLEFLTQSMLRAALSGDRAVSQPQSGVGSKGLGEVHAAFTQLHNELILDQVLMFINQYFMPLFALYNRGENGPPIWLETQGLDPIEKENLFSLIGIAGNSQTFQEAFYYVDWKRLFEGNSIPTLTEEEVSSLKERLNQEALDKQEAFQEVQAKFAPAQKPGGVKDSEKPPEQRANAKLEYNELVGQLLGSDRVPIALSFDEVNLIGQYRGWDEETIKLFNPFHSRSDGRFTSHPGGAGGVVTPGGSTSGIGDTVAETKANTVSKASKTGKVIKTTGKVLGLAGLGVVGLAVISTLGGGSEPQISPGPPGDNQPGNNDKQQKLEEAQKKLDELTKNWPKTSSPEEAASLMESTLRNLGIKDIPPDLKVVVGSTADGTGGNYRAETNTLTINSSVANSLQSGDPTAVWSIMHEVGHSAQEVNGGVGDTSELVDSQENINNYHAALEGQNDLVTAIGMSSLYKQPMSQDGAMQAQHQYNEAQSLVSFYETGTNLQGSYVETVALGYPEESKAWAGVAAAMSSSQGGSPLDNLIAVHDNGFDPNYSHNVLMNLFPNQMTSGGYYTQTEEGGFLGIGTTTVTHRTYPTPQQIESWLKDQYNIDSSYSFNTMIEDAAGH